MIDDGLRLDIGAAIAGSLDGLDRATAGLGLGYRAGPLDIGVRAGLALVDRDLGWTAGAMLSYRF